MYVEGEIPASVNTGNNGCNGGFFGANGFGDLAALIVVAGLFGGFGNGFGFGGNGGANADLQRGFDTQSITSKLNGIENGICDSTFALNNTITGGINSIQQSLCQGFNGVNNSIYQNGTDTRFAINDLGYKLQDCCCQTQRAIENVNYNMATNTCNIIQAQNAGVQRIIDYMSSEKIASLQAENQALKFQASQSAQNAFITANQSAQTAELIRRLGRDCPNNNCCYNPCGCGNGTNSIQ